MAPVITLVRHAQGEHNLFKDYQTIDPVLTDLGMRQCLEVRNQFPHHANISHILVSPLFRTIETGFHCFRPAIDRGIQIIAMPEVTANTPDGCNQGHAPEEIIEWARTAFGGDFLDEKSFRDLPDCWYDKYAGLYADEESKLKLRAFVARHNIRRVATAAGDDAHIVVVSHKEFLPYITGPGPQWKNVEWRSYTIGADDEATLTQISP